jgi:acyl carrier protein
MLDQITRSPRDRLLTLVGQLLADRSGLRTVSPDDTLTDIGLSSINMVTLMLEVEAEFDVTIPQSDITPENFKSVATIEALIVRLRPAAA